MSSSQAISSKRLCVEQQYKESAESLMPIFFRMNDGDVMKLYGTRVSTVDTLLGVVSFENKSLFYLGKEVELDQKFDHYGILPESTIDVIDNKYKDKYMSVWTTLETIVTSAYRMCANEHVSEKIPHLLKKFLQRVHADGEPCAHYLSMIKSLFVVEAICHLYSSTNYNSGMCGESLIIKFIESLEELSTTRPNLSAYFLSPFLQFCLCLKVTHDTTNLLYKRCRKQLCKHVNSIFSPNSDPEVRKSLISLADIFPLVTEIGNELVVILKNHPVEVLSQSQQQDILSFSLIFTAAMRLMDDKMKDDTTTASVTDMSHPLYIQHQSLRWLFHHLYYVVDLALDKAKCSWIEKPPTSVVSGYLSLLKTLDVISCLFEDTKGRMASMLEDRKKTLDILGYDAKK